MHSIRSKLPVQFALLLTLFLTGCQRYQATNPTIILYAASSLHDAMDGLADAFSQQHPEVSFQTNYASSAQLAIQLQQGAQADVFASADAQQMDYAIESSRIAADPITFASNSLVILVPSGNPGSISGIMDMANPWVRILAAVPGTPLREYSDQALNRLTLQYSNGESIQNQIYENIVSEEENARQVVAKIALGEADAAFVYRSDAESELAEQSQSYEIPSQFQVEVTYMIAPVVEGRQPSWSERFIDFTLSPSGQEILADWGFGPMINP